MRRSSSSAFFGAGRLKAAPFIGFCERASSRAAPFLATVTPGDRDSECDVKSAECRAEYRVTPRYGREQSDGAGSHEAQAHHGHDLNRERSPCYYSCSI